MSAFNNFKSLTSQMSLYITYAKLEEGFDGDKDELKEEAHLTTKQIHTITNRLEN